jgi:hypothetical protein
VTEGKPLPEERVTECEVPEGKPLPAERAMEGEVPEGKSLPEERTMEGRSMEGKSIAAKREGAGSHEAARAGKGGPTKMATAKCRATKATAAKGGATKATSTKAAVNGRRAQSRGGRGNHRGGQSSHYVAHHDAPPLSGDAPQPLCIKLGGSHRVAGCGIVARWFWNPGRKDQSGGARQRAPTTLSVARLQAVDAIAAVMFSPVVFRRRGELRRIDARDANGSVRKRQDWRHAIRCT